MDIKSLTSLRFFFAFGVFLHHYSIASEHTIFPEGYLGVSFFFILSGFIISYRYKKKIIEGTISKKEYLVARIARIYPLHLLTFLIALLLAIRNVAKTGESFAWIQSIFNVTLLQSFIPSKSYYFCFNDVSWSISDELFFYLMFPILIACFTKIRARIIFILCLFLAIIYFTGIIIIPEKYHHALFYISPFTRIIDFVIGIGIYYVWDYMQTFKFRKTQYYIFLTKKNMATILEVTSICVLIAMVLLSKEIPQVYRYASYYWIPMAIIILCFALSSTSSMGGYISKILSLKPLVIAGEISFGFYMFHVHIIAISRSIYNKYIANFFVIPNILEFLVVFIILLTVSIISFYFFEKPVNKWIRKCFIENKYSQTRY